MRSRSTHAFAFIAALAIVTSVGPPADASHARTPMEITATAKGRELARQGATRHTALGVARKASNLKVWQLAGGDYLVGTRLPENLATSTTHNPDGSVVLEVSYDVGAEDRGLPKIASLDGLTAAVPTWAWRDQDCFSRIGNAAGWLDSCYALHKLVYETSSYDYWKLEQWGTLAAKGLGKIYNGWLAAKKASSGSSAMTWQDWSPRGNVSGSCVNLTLRVEALGAAFTSPAFFCEQNIPHKYSAAGSFKMEWSCGCIWPFGQPYPNSRKIDYLQAVRVVNGGSVRWTLSAGMHAR